jgi:hypothetical protein
MSTSTNEEVLYTGSEDYNRRRFAKTDTWTVSGARVSGMYDGSLITLIDFLKLPKSGSPRERRTVTISIPNASLVELLYYPPHGVPSTLSTSEVVVWSSLETTTSPDERRLPSSSSPSTESPQTYGWCVRRPTTTTSPSSSSQEETSETLWMKWMTSRFSRR